MVPFANLKSNARLRTTSRSSLGAGFRDAHQRSEALVSFVLKTGSQLACAPITQGPKSLGWKQRRTCTFCSTMDFLRNGPLIQTCACWFVPPLSHGHASTLFLHLILLAFSILLRSSDSSNSSIYLLRTEDYKSSAYPAVRAFSWKYMQLSRPTHCPHTFYFSTV